MTRRPPAAQTALGPMVIVAIEQYTPPGGRVTDDELAVRLLPAGMRAMIRFPAVRRMLRSATERQGEGLWGSFLCRKRYADDRLAEAVDDGIEQVVVLGAGLDTRAYRLAPGIPVVEADLPANIAGKRARLESALGGVPDNVTLLPVDFEADDLGAMLDLRPRTIFIWEAVTQYLTEDAVRRVFALLAGAAAGSRLVFTYVRTDFLDGTHLYGAERAHREFVTRRRVWHFGLAPGQVARFLRDYGWTETDQAGPAEYRTRYLTTRPRLKVSELERSVTATKD